MRRMIMLALLVAALGITVLPAAAQVGPRVTPVTVAATAINNASNAQKFNPDTHFVVTDVQNASAEASEPAHSCSSPTGTGSDTVWFTTYLTPGTLTLDTTDSGFTTGTGPSSNTVISLYWLDNWSFSGFGDLDQLACNDNGAGAGIINSFNITKAGTYYVQVSSSPAITVTGPSTIILRATAHPTNAPSFDDPESAKTLKFLSLPSILHISSATRSLDEPEDPNLTAYTTSNPSVPNYVTNTVWFTFTLTHPQIVGVQNFYDASGDFWLSLFEYDGMDYTPAAGVFSGENVNILTAMLDPGTYYLRIGVIGEPAGSTTTFATFTALIYFLPHNYEFSVGDTEGSAGATANLNDWTLKNASSGPTGDGIFCDAVPNYSCYLQLSSSGGNEATSAQTTVNLDSVKVKKGDIVLIQARPEDMIGTPNLAVSLTLTDAAGVKQKYKFTLTDDVNISLVTQATASITATKAKIKLKNKDTVSGNRIEIDGVVAAALRTGEGVTRGATPTLDGLSLSWTGSARATPDGVKPAPPPAQ